MQTDEGYLLVIDAVESTYRDAMDHYPRGVDRPRFAFGPREILFVASLEHMIDRIARNEGAVVFLESIVTGARRIGPNAMPTVNMMRVALERAGAQIEYLSAAAFFGIAIGEA